MRNFLLIWGLFSLSAFSAFEEPGQENKLDWTFTFSSGYSKRVTDSDGNNRAKGESLTGLAELRLHYWRFGLALDSSYSYAELHEGSVSSEGTETWSNMSRNSISLGSFQVFADYSLPVLSSLEFIPRLGFGGFHLNYRNDQSNLGGGTEIAQGGIQSVVGLDLESSNWALLLDYAVSMTMKGSVRKGVVDYLEDRKGSLNRFRGSTIWKTGDHWWLGLQFVRTNFRTTEFIG